MNGESLINDASGLVAFRFAVATAVTGAFRWSDAVFQFFILSGGGLALGLAIAWAIGHIRLALKRYCVEDPTIQTVLSVLTPYAAYLAAEATGVGSILAIVAAGLYAGAHDARHLDAPTRAHAWEVWKMLLFAFNGLGVRVARRPAAFAGDGAHPREHAGGLGYALVLSAALVALRVCWVFPAAYLPSLLSQWIRAREGIPGRGPVFITAWAGIRGSVTLAAALSIPYTTASGAPFPGRDLIILLAASAIVITLLLNSLTLQPLIRLLKVRGDGIAEREERAARNRHGAGSDRHFANSGYRNWRARGGPVRGVVARAISATTAAAFGQRRTAAATRRAARLTEANLARSGSRRRKELMQMREQNVINDEVMRILEGDIDVEEALIIGATRHGH